MSEFNKAKKKQQPIVYRPQPQQKPTDETGLYLPIADDIRGVGRPKGRKTSVAEPTKLFRPRCTECGSTVVALSRRVTINDTFYTDKDGNVFDRVVVYKRKCGGCGQVRIEREYIIKGQPDEGEMS